MSIPLTRRGWIVAAVAAVVVLAGVAAGVVALTSGGQKAAVPPPSHAAASPASPKPRRPALNPLTGRAPSSNPVVAVKIDDTAASHPQIGIDKADIVYIEQAEGGLTRLMAIYNTKLPVVGPVRSTRAGDEKLALQFGSIVYVASGGSPPELRPLEATSLRTSINDHGGPGFTRDPNRPVPYNLKADLSAIAKKLKGPRAKSIGLTWSARATNPGAHRARALHTVVGGTPVAFEWRPKLHRYVRMIGGKAQYAADGAPIATPNVVVQFCRVTTYHRDVDTAGNPAKYTHTIGTGKVAVFRDGRRIDGTWSRRSLHGGTHLRDKHGKPIALAPGGAWFVLAATGAPLT